MIRVEDDLGRRSVLHDRGLQNEVQLKEVLIGVLNL